MGPIPGWHKNPSRGIRTDFCNFSKNALLYNDCMAWTPPIDRRGKRDLLSEDRFYDLLSQQCNYMDKDAVSDFYMGVVKLVAQELRTNKIARLPHLGDFALVEQRPRIGWAGKSRVFFDSRDVLRFYPKEALRRYFNKRQEVA